MRISGGSWDFVKVGMGQDYCMVNQEGLMPFFMLFIFML
jgi:hypothetical protein